MARKGLRYIRMRHKISKSLMLLLILIPMVLSDMTVPGSHDQSNENIMDASQLSNNNVFKHVSNRSFIESQREEFTQLSDLYATLQQNEVRNEQLLFGESNSASLLPLPGFLFDTATSSGTPLIQLPVIQFMFPFTVSDFLPQMSNQVGNMFNHQSHTSTGIRYSASIGNNLAAAAPSLSVSPAQSSSVNSGNMTLSGVGGSTASPQQMQEDHDQNEAQDNNASSSSNEANYNKPAPSGNESSTAVLPLNEPIIAAQSTPSHKVSNVPEPPSWVLFLFIVMYILIQKINCYHVTTLLRSESN